MDYVNRLATTVNTTAECRFIAAARLERRDLRMTQLTSFTSAYLIVLTVLPYFLRLPELVEDHVNLLSVGLSIVILVSSLSQYARGDVVKAEQHHRCGLELKQLHRQITSTQKMSEEEFRSLSAEYSSIMGKFGSNHEVVDYRAFELSRKSELNWVTFPRALNSWVQVFFANESPRIALLGSTAVTLGVIFIYALPAQLPA